MGTYERTNRLKLVFVGHAYNEINLQVKLEEISVRFVSVLVIDTVHRW
jgi:hypothetical protein